MRWIVLMIIFSGAVLFFISAAYFPDVLNGYPQLKPYVIKAQNLLGMHVSDSKYLDDKLIEQADKFLQNEDKREKYKEVCGLQPENPWGGNAVPSDEDLDKYLARKKAWDKCLQEQKLQGLKEGIKKRINQTASEEPIMEYLE